MCDAIRGVSTPDQVAAQAAALARVRADRIERDNAAKHVAAIDERFRQSILAALATGAAPKDVAVAADLSRQRISQIKKSGQ